MRRKILLCLLILVLLLIWGQSCLPADLSRQESKGIFDLIKPVLVFFLGEDQVTHHLIRKLAHFTEFFLLGGLISLLLPMDWKKRLLCCGFCLLAAFLDETIQVFSDRGDQVVDVWLDFAGAAAGILLVTGFRYLASVRHSRAEGSASGGR